MFRALTLLRSSSSKFVGCHFVPKSSPLVKWASSIPSISPVPNQEKENKADSIKLEKLPSWIRSDVDKQIYQAENLSDLLSVTKNQKFNGVNVITIVNTLSKWCSEGKSKPEAFLSTKEWKIVDNFIQKGNLRVPVPQVLQAIKNLTALGMKPESKTIESLEMEILWNLRKSNLRQHFQILDFQSQFLHTETQKKVLKETLHGIQRRWIELAEPGEFLSVFQMSKHFDSKFLDKVENHLLEMVENFSQVDKVKILISLNFNKRRPTPLLRALCYHLNKENEPFQPRMTADILFALNHLSFYDLSLMDRICSDLSSQSTSNLTSLIMGSVMTSIGQMKYRHEGVLFMLCDWTNDNFDQCRHQDIISLLLCLANVNYIPTYWDCLSAKIVTKLDKRNEGLPDLAWLNVVWSSAVLKLATPAMIQSVFNQKFMRSMAECIAEQPGNSAIKLKLNQLWALAQLEKMEMQSEGSPFTMPLAVDELSGRTSDDASTLKKSVLEALASLAPAPKYLEVDARTSLGVTIDAQLILGANGIPVPLPENQSPTPPLANQFRVGVMILDYKDLCLGSHHPIGTNVLRERLLSQLNYVVAKVLHTEFNIQDKTLKKVQLLERLMKRAISSSRAA